MPTTDTFEEWRQRCIGHPVADSNAAFLLRLARTRNTVSDEVVEGLRNSVAKEQGNADGEFGHGYVKVNEYPSNG